MTVTIEKRKITPRAHTQKKRPETREEKMIAALSPNLNVMVQAVRKAGHSMIRDFGEISSLQVSQKGPGDFVSNADTFAEKNLISYLREARPDFGFVSEECGELKSDSDSKMKWVIDPIDGTTNFLHAIPVFAISVALMDADEVVAGVIYNPITNELYYAEKGQGAFLMTPTGNRRLRVSGRTKLEYALVGSNAFSNQESRNTMIKVADKVASTRFNGCSTLSLTSVAAGQLDAYVARQFKIWDLAAGYLLIKEAGGFVSDFKGNRDLLSIIKSQSLVACSMSLRDGFVKLLGE
jgi:myo-inositol-1(or 4)-monophosphatase